VGRQRKVSTTRVIAGDRQAIFDLIADPGMHPVIDGSGTVTGARAEAPERLHLGARFGMDMRMGAAYGIENEVVEFEEGERIAWRHFSGHRWRYELEDVEGGTAVTETFDWSGARAKLPLQLAGFPRRNLAAMRRTLERLDRLVTTGSADASDAA
jgi:uncharacterized protein YndB with AHSA1/START domain